MKDPRLPEKLVWSLSEAFAKKAAPLCEKVGWVWNLGGAEGFPSADRVAEVCRVMLRKIGVGTLGQGYGRFEAGCVGVGCEDDCLYWLRFLGEDLIVVVWRTTRPPSSGFAWGKARLSFPKQRAVKTPEPVVEQ